MFNNKNIKIVIFIILNLFLFINVVFRQSKYDDLVKQYEIYYNAYDVFTAKIELTDNADQMSTIINDFVDKIQAITENILTVKRKYPELNTVKDYPDNLKAILLKINKFLKSKRLRDVQYKTYQFKTKSKAMEEAIKRLEKLKKNQ